MNYKKLINDIYNFEWSNDYDNVKHWNKISLEYKDSDKKILTFEGKLNIEEKPFNLFFSNNIEEFYRSSFGYIDFDIIIENDLIVATNTENKESDSIKAKDVTELMVSLNEIFAKKLLKISKEMDQDSKDMAENKEYNYSVFDSYSLPFKIAKTMSIHYNFENKVWDIKNESMFEDELDPRTLVFKEITKYLKEYSDESWTSDFILNCQKDFDIPWLEKYKIFNMIQKILLEQNCIDDDLGIQMDKKHCRLFNTIFKFN